MENLNAFHLINLLCVFLSWYVAQHCEQYSKGWWFNMVASALNAVIILKAIV